MVTLHAALAVVLLSSAGDSALLDFYTDSCGPCRAMNPTVQALIDKGYPVRRVNVEKERALAAQYGVSSVPTFVMVVDGREVDRVVSSTSYSRLERMCKLAQPNHPAGPSPLLSIQGPGTSLAASKAPSLMPSNAMAGNPLSMPKASSPLAPPDTGATTLAPLGGRSPLRGGSLVLDDALLAASVRLKIQDADGQSVGSGTIIDAREGEALILTCGHVFRDSKGKGRIEVDLYGSAPAERLQGRLVSYDLERDIGLVVIRVPGPVAVARVAPPGYRIGQGDSVITVGCNNGSRPTAVHSRIASVNKFLGPPNFQVSGQPVEGRSGGGLFSEDGLVVGLCNAADPSDREGLFAALPTIQGELDRLKLAFVYQAPADTQLAAATRAPDIPTMPKHMPSGRDPEPSAVRPASATIETSLAPSAAETAAIEELRKRLQEGAEVVCVVRSRKDPAAPTEVIMLDKVTPNFLNQLYAASKPQPLDEADPRATPTVGVSSRSMEVPITPAVRSATGPRISSPRPGAIQWNADPTAWRPGP